MRPHGTPLKLLIFFVGILVVPTLLAESVRAADNYTVLHNFTGDEDGGDVAPGLALDGQGNLYGMTYSGGTDMWCDAGCGVIFKLMPGAGGQWGESALYDFNQNSGGASPNGLLFSSDGKLYGATNAFPGRPGGVFEMIPGPDDWNLRLIYSGGGCLVFNGAGDFFGCIGAGEHEAGAVGELSPAPDGWVYSQLYSFCSLPKCVDGYDVEGPLSVDGNGNIYGTTNFGGNDYGLAFELTHNRASSSIGDSWTYHIMHRFGAFPTDGGYPGSGLVLDKLGNAYGVSYNGGANGNGAVYKLTPLPGAPLTWKETQIYNFPLDIGDGGFPVGNLVFDRAGNLYGSAGGGTGCNAYGCGVIFELTPQANGQWSYSVVHYFNGEDGFGPNPLAIDENGNLFGTTSNGGPYNVGVAFEITP